jgi:hypothetical protein
LCDTRRHSCHIAEFAEQLAPRDGWTAPCCVRGHPRLNHRLVIVFALGKPSYNSNLAYQARMLQFGFGLSF